MADDMGEGQATDLKRRQIMRWGLVGAALFMAGCQVVPKGPPKPVEAPPEEGAVTGLPSDATRHRIALLVPLTGSNAGIGQSIANAANMAVLDTGGERIRMTVYDTAGGAAAAADKAIDGIRSTIDFEARRKVWQEFQAVIHDEQQLIRSTLLRNGIKIFWGFASFVDEHTISIDSADGDRTLTTAFTLLACGTRPVKTTLSPMPSCCACWRSLASSRPPPTSSRLACGRAAAMRGKACSSRSSPFWLVSRLTTAMSIAPRSGSRVRRGCSWATSTRRATSFMRPSGAATSRAGR
mgnify:CR=1 FL=1